MTCDSCTGDCPCAPARPRGRDNLLDTAHIPYLPNDARFHAQVEEKLADLFRCEVSDCHMGPAANVYTATVRAPDGKQRTVLGCVKHLDVRVAHALSAVRLEPFD